MEMEMSEWGKGVSSGWTEGAAEELIAIQKKWAEKTGSFQNRFVRIVHEGVEANLEWDASQLSWIKEAFPEQNKDPGSLLCVVEGKEYTYGKFTLEKADSKMYETFARKIASEIPESSVSQWILEPGETFEGDVKVANRKSVWGDFILNEEGASPYSVLSHVGEAMKGESWKELGARELSPPWDQKERREKRANQRRIEEAVDACVQMCEFWSEEGNCEGAKMMLITSGDLKVSLETPLPELPHYRITLQNCWRAEYKSFLKLIEAQLQKKVCVEGFGLREVEENGAEIGERHFPQKSVSWTWGKESVSSPSTERVRAWSF